MGFYPQVRAISDSMNSAHQTMFLSATWPKEVQKLSNEICKNNPVRLKIGEDNLTLNNSIIQCTEYVAEMDKKRRLLELLKSNNDSVSKFIIFMRTKKSCDKICKILENEGYKAIAIHGDKHQNVTLILILAKRLYHSFVSKFSQEHTSSNRRRFKRTR